MITPITGCLVRLESQSALYYLFQFILTCSMSESLKKFLIGALNFALDDFFESEHALFLLFQDNIIFNRI